MSTIPATQEVIRRMRLEANGGERELRKSQCLQTKLGMVANDCDLSYEGGRGLRAAQGKNVRSYLKNN
jgi:hypothetical protein